MELTMDPLVLSLALLVSICPSEASELLGYGTKFGSQLDDSDRKNVIGLGASPAFLRSENEEALLEVWRRYQLYKTLVNETSSSQGNVCQDECPPSSHCSHGFCFCDSDISNESLEVGSKLTDQQNGENEAGLLDNICASHHENHTISEKVTEIERILDFSCNETSDCWQFGLNLQCRESQCVCRDGMKFDRDTYSCAIFVEVDCSNYGHNSPVTESLKHIIEDIMAGNITTENSEIPESLLAFLEPITSGIWTQDEVEEAFCRDVHHFGQYFDEREDDSTLALMAVILGVVVVVVILVLGFIALSGCICWCCLDSCCRKNRSSKGYSKDLEKSGDITDAGEDVLEKVMTGYQPVPQHPPPGYPQGSASLPRGTAPPTKGTSLPRGASLPRNGGHSKTNSVSRVVSPIPRAYPHLEEAPPGYPESPQRTGPPPLGYPQSPPEYPQTPTPPGFPCSNSGKATKPLYPQIPTK